MFLQGELDCKMVFVSLTIDYDDVIAKIRKRSIGRTQNKK